MARGRLDWVNKMKGKGYASVAQAATASQSLAEAEHEVKKARWTLDLYRKFGSPQQLKVLEANVESAKSDLMVARHRGVRFEERLDYYKTMVDNCTIKAPHDGFVIYAPPKFWSSEGKVEPGARVRQMQDLFYLPDLSRMRVAALLHESIMPKVHPGMTVRARIEGLSGREIEGHVLEIAPLPDTQMGWLSDAKSFKATIALDSSRAASGPR